MKRTGYLVANLHQGTGIRMWDTINEEAKEHEEKTIFVLPGGRINYKKADEYRRNVIFSYATKENMDGAVVWSSSLTGEANWQEVSAWTKKLSEKIPLISLGIDIENIPSITFDAYNGIYKIVEHFILCHKRKRIAFIRGPENHESALRRYEAYLDALRDFKIKIDPKLISSPYAWNEGDSAIREIVEANQMTPQKDFDCVVSSSDMMAFRVANYLEDHGYVIPDDVAISGFNDSPEAFLSSVELTTVRTPIKEMIEKSFYTINKMEENPKAFGSSIKLDSPLVFRRSCGCDEIYGSEKELDKIKDYSSYERWIREKINDSHSASILLEIVKNLFVDGIVVEKESRRHFEEMCWRYIKAGGEMKFFFSAIKMAKMIFSSRSFSSRETYLLAEILMESNARISATKSYREREINTIHNTFANKLLKVHSYSEMGEAIKKYFPLLGIEKAFVFKYVGENQTRLECGFSRDKLFTKGNEFSRSYLYPEELSHEIQRGLFVVNPLFYDNELEGYMILKNRDCHAIMIENLRTDISSSLQAIDLYSLASQKSQKAEEEEKKVANFYALLSEELKEPIEKIKTILNSHTDIDREEILSTITKTEHLLNLSIAEKGELSLSKSFVPLERILKRLEEKNIRVNKPNKLPSLQIDEERTKEVFDLITLLYSSDVTVTVTLSSEKVILYFSSLKELKSSSRQTVEYIEKVILLMGGSFEFSRDGILIYLLYPSFSGSFMDEKGKEGVLFISAYSEMDSSLFEGLVTLMSPERALESIDSLSKYSSIAWNIEESNKQSSLALNLFRKHKDIKRMPFLLFGFKDVSISLNAAVETILPEEEKGDIFSVGHFPENLNILRKFAPVRECKDLGELRDKTNSSLFVFSSVDIDAIEAIRKNRTLAKTPILIVKDRFKMEEAEILSSTPGVLLVNTAITEAEGFINRIISIFAGEELLPPLTSILVKKAIAYLNDNATNSISRWQIAGSVNISEDYLTRIFRKEIGISPWDYLNRYRIQIASRLLLETGSSISEIASLTGFQDQAYFCRVFRKVKGFPPGNIRNRL